MAGKTFMADTGYVLVADRHAQFVKDYPDGAVRTDLVYGSDHLVVVKCEVWKVRPDETTYMRPPDGTGMASMPIPGPTPFTKNSEVENAETSALGRALAMIGYHPKERMASDDEIAMKAVKPEETVDHISDHLPDILPATPKQKVKLMAWGKKLLGDEKAVRAFVKREVGVYKSADLTRDHISTLFDLFKVIESTGGAMEGVDEDE